MWLINLLIVPVLFLVVFCSTRGANYEEKPITEEVRLSATNTVTVCSYQPQLRESQIKVEVPRELIEVDDGDTIFVEWPDGDDETVRLLGIDTAEVAHDFPKMDDQPFGPEARGFMTGVLAMADRVELRRANCSDKYDRTLAYLFVDGRNYSTLAVEARLAFETVTKYGDNGFPEESAEVLEAADRAVMPLLDESPSDFRARMREKYSSKP